MSIPSAVKPYPTVAPIGTVDVAAAKAADDKKAAADQKDMFLKLLVAQLSNQDPSAPMDQKDMMAQMTQFSQVEQMTNMVTSIKDLTSATNLSQNVGLIGKSVSYAGLAPDGQTQVIKTGKVTGVTNGTTGVTLQLDTNVSINGTDVKRVFDGSATTTPTTPTTPTTTTDPATT
jgi:flagellar basal-body rod modification protein FlgD